MELSIIVAMTNEGVIGNNEKLPWHIPEDLKIFRKITQGNTILMGRKTFDSLLNKPLQNRINIVISKKDLYSSCQQLNFFNNLDAGLEYAESLGKKIFVIGGSSLYAQTLPIVDKLYISKIKQNYQGNIFFPKFDISPWNLISEEDFKDFNHCIYTRSFINGARAI